jgi:hypothetical protein
MDIVNPIPPKNPTPMIVSNSNQRGVYKFLKKQPQVKKDKIPIGFPD